jgi:hypothetical protein
VIVKLGDRAHRVAAGVGGVVVRAVVIDGPVQKLEMAVAADRVYVEKVDRAELPGAQLEPSYRNIGEHREWPTFLRFVCCSERNDRLNHEASHVRPCSQCRVSNHVEIGEACQSERIADAPSTRALEVEEHFRIAAELIAGVDRDHVG